MPRERYQTRTWSIFIAIICQLSVRIKGDISASITGPVQVVRGRSITFSCTYSFSSTFSVSLLGICQITQTRQQQDCMFCSFAGFFRNFSTASLYRDSDLGCPSPPQVYLAPVSPKVLNVTFKPFATDSPTYHFCMAADFASSTVAMPNLLAINVVDSAPADSPTTPTTSTSPRVFDQIISSTSLSTAGNSSGAAAAASSGPTADALWWVYMLVAILVAAAVGAGFFFYFRRRRAMAARLRRRQHPRGGASGRLPSALDQHRGRSTAHPGSVPVGFGLQRSPGGHLPSQATARRGLQITLERSVS